MAVENFDPEPEPGRDLGPLIHALRRNGGTLTFAQWVMVPNSMTVNLHLPDDEEQAEKCRAAIDGIMFGFVIPEHYALGGDHPVFTVGVGALAYTFGLRHAFAC